MDGTPFFVGTPVWLTRPTLRSPDFPYLFFPSECAHPGLTCGVWRSTMPSCWGLRCGASAAMGTKGFPVLIILIVFRWLGLGMRSGGGSVAVDRSLARSVGRSFDRCLVACATFLMTCALRRTGHALVVSPTRFPLYLSSIQCFPCVYSSAGCLGQNSPTSLWMCRTHCGGCGSL